jgi:predicted RNA-binding protein YlqC (UPF0109 family)
MLRTRKLVNYFIFRKNVNIINNNNNIFSSHPFAGLVRDLQAQVSTLTTTQPYIIKCPRFKANIEVVGPKEHHGFIIGKEGSKLRALKSGVIKLGAKCGHIIEAARKITGMSQVMV